MELLSRTLPTVNVEETVAAILAEVRREGDAALYRYTEKFDGVRLTALAVTEEEIEEAMALVEPRFLESPWGLLRECV